MLKQTDGTVSTSTRSFLWRALRFTLIGLLLYGLVYIAAEQLAHHYAQRNRFHAVKTAPQVQYDHVILGASHAAVFDYEDMNARLEAMTHSKILNLSVVGGGIAINRVMLEYFLNAHRTANVVYVIDSFVFYSREWNEDRLQDARLFVRAPFDPALVPILLRNAASPVVALDYLSGFSKINNADRFKPDISEDESVKFNKTYRPVKQIDTQRIEFLYPKQTDAQMLARYIAEFEALIRYLKQRNIGLIVIKPPLPSRVYAMLPNEAQFDSALKRVLAQHGIAFHDFSLAGNDDKFFFNTDHLNRSGVLNFFEGHLKAILAR
jgi:hypothetical protein